MKTVYSENDLRHHPFKRFFLEVWWARKELWTLIKRVAMIGLISWGGVKYLTQNGRRSISDGLKAQKEAVNETPVMQKFYEGLGVIKEIKAESDYRKSPAGRAQTEAWRKEQAKRRADLKEMGIEPTLRYVKPGDPEYAQAAKDFRDLMNDRIR